jgi:hypothetical protein
MKGFQGILEIATFLAIVAIGLLVAFTGYQHSSAAIGAANWRRDDTRHLRVRDGSQLERAYLGRPGGYVDAPRLAVAVALSERSDIPIRILGRTYAAEGDIIGDIDYLTYLVYNDLRTWWNGFRSSPEYTNAFLLGRIYEYHGDIKARTFNPNHVTHDVPGFIFANPRTLEEARFKLQVIGIPDGGETRLEYHLFIFLGSLVSREAEMEHSVEYRWYAVVTGNNSTGVPWVILD